MRCVICNWQIEGYGNNPAPFGNGFGRACDDCNTRFVIPARIIYGRKVTPDRGMQALKFLQEIARLGSNLRRYDKAKKDKTDG